METNKEKWAGIFEEWESSGLKRVDYCRKHQIPVTTFDYWRGRIRKESAAKKRSPGLVKLPSMLKLSGDSARFIIEYPCGHKLHVPAGYASEELKRLVKELSEVFR